MTTETQQKPEAEVPALQAEALGLEDITPNDLVLPHIILTQSLSKFVTEEKFPVGVYVNTLSKKIYESVEILPFKATKYINLLQPKGDKMVFEARVQEGDARTTGRRFFPEKTESGTKKANAQSVIAILCLVEGQPAIMTFSKTSYTAGKELLTMATLASGAFWKRKYTLAPKKVTGEYTYYISTVKDAGASTTAEWNAASKLYTSMASKAKEVVERSDGAPDAEEVPF